MKKGVVALGFLVLIFMSMGVVCAVCTDSDGGFYPYVKGNITLEGNRSDYCLKDNWPEYNSKILYEYSH